jgi:hypothetical protein
MSLHRKVLCAQCSHYTDCSQATRLFINYCGSKSKQITQKLFDACEECRERQGFMFKRNFDPVIKAAYIPLALSMVQ